MNRHLNVLIGPFGAVIAAFVAVAVAANSAQAADHHGAWQPRRTPDAAIDVGGTYQLQLEPTCYDGSGNPLSDTVTATISGQPTTGGATATFVPNPVQTFSNTTLTITTTKRTDAGIYNVSVGGQGPVCGTYTPYNFPLTLRPLLSMQRQDLMTIVSTGDPQKGGTFSYDVQAVSGPTIAGIQMADGVSATTNPNSAKLTEPPNPDGKGRPSPGGLASMTVNYEIGGISASNDKSNPFKVPLFGMSCYYTAYESDWGTPPAACGKTKVDGVVYSGTITDPDGYPGTYCLAFIKTVEIQGSGVLNSSQKIQFDPSTGKIRNTKKITGADGTEVVIGATVARARSIIPGKGVHVAINGVGQSLLANDTGGRIKNYRLDLYNGAGKAVCEGYDNRMRVVACTPAQAACPKSDLK